MTDISIVLCGEAGQGIETIEDILTKYLKESRYNIFSAREYMSRIRGGVNSTEIRISPNPVKAYVDRIDLLFAFSNNAIDHLKERISEKTIIFGDKEVVGNLENVVDIPLLKTTKKIGGSFYLNTVTAGVISGLLNLSEYELRNFIKKYFERKGEEIINKNLEAITEGFQLAKNILESGISIKAKKSEELSRDIGKDILFSGTEAVALGALAGGCNFISAYPMSPATGVISFMASNSKDFEVIAEQAEDEISAMNMAIGSWYAGGRGMTTTSGGGFALMEEGLSLSGMTETPVVVHIGQRPSPATGLPTRTEQGDLDLALYAGHGDFARVVLSPGNLEDCFYLSKYAFSLADRLQIPVFILTDQYLLNLQYNIPSLDYNKYPVKRYVVKTEKDYRRYELNKTGISPRGIPGFGEGTVVQTGNEHDETGHSTENAILRKKMVEKRYNEKLNQLKNEVIYPELIGGKAYRNLLIGWGSTRCIIEEALKELRDPKLGFLHFKQLYPLPREVMGYLMNAEKVIAIENNASGQFANLIRRETGFEIKNRILKYDGRSFSVEEVATKVREILGE
ncbi:MAG TPA: 2-oxoacid:acceptor oxidoreductase subunit alpha [Methanofastidiosum sp.]|nr:2-oxoacid:acceptor oxidoreductase subunit alpha [Methanofastidiosum sp.]HPA48957.1 2-oxoacid:acceptor oxidoreductase subunit alpha [Methanofastidiosum sp.]HQK62119.1 2-oxoacid:acceptor oxidoreductase subunit alpha [Methanofastidiosum sp.]HQM94299.1 2-oxoacid:acceptor oxidoreductase subunit alpha [Methanofastidiosum sp.]HQQ48392.1 2-oxoacid:acceptor oxidoreductase subunit alpha [Methanofastidiosum sp.]